MKFKDLLNENWAKAKRLINVRNPLFHATNSVIQILRSKEIRSSLDGVSSFGGTQSGISLARNLDSLTKDWRFGRNILVLDGDLIKRKFKTQPFDYWKDKKNTSSFEFEERVSSEKIPIKNILKGVIIDGYGANKMYYKDWASWKEQFNLKFDVIVKDGNKYFYAKDKL